MHVPQQTPRVPWWPLLNPSFSMKGKHSEGATRCLQSALAGAAGTPYSSPPTPVTPGSLLQQV